MELTGKQLIGRQVRFGTEGTQRAINPATGDEIEPPFGGGSTDDVDTACALASAAFDSYRDISLERRAQFLEAIAQGIIDLGDVLVNRVMAESGLPRPRVEGERARTAGQLRLFASLVREGRFLAATVALPLPEPKPLPRADLRAQKIALGPVAVFGASNFPLAFSVAGGDTASALAAGNPVIVKAHPAHPGTSALVGQAIRESVKACGLPEGVFSMLFDAGVDVGVQLVKHPAIKAVAFTGSFAGGTALMKLAAARPEPIPCYSEMGSVNPVFVLPGALKQRGSAVATELQTSFTLGAGQFCTKPGLVLVPQQDGAPAFMKELGDKVCDTPAQTLLTKAIADRYTAAVKGRLSDATVLAQGAEPDGSSTAATVQA